MAKHIYPAEGDLHNFIEVLEKGNYKIKKYLPPITERWYSVVSECVEYVRYTSSYEDLSFGEVCAKLLYKISKRHELGDGNKRSSVIAVYLFCLLNDCRLTKPTVIKQQARRAAATKGSINEMTMRKRIAMVLQKVMERADMK